MKISKNKKVFFIFSIIIIILTCLYFFAICPLMGIIYTNKGDSAIKNNEFKKAKSYLNTALYFYPKNIKPNSLYYLALKKENAQIEAITNFVKKAYQKTKNIYFKNLYNEYILLNKKPQKPELNASSGKYAKEFFVKVINPSKNTYFKINDKPFKKYTEKIDLKSGKNLVYIYNQNELSSEISFYEFDVGEDFLENVDSSKKSGYYSEDFELSFINSNNYDIYYTTTNKGDYVKYKSPIKINNTTNINFFAYKDGKFSKTSTLYFSMDEGSPNKDNFNNGGLCLNYKNEDFYTDPDFYITKLKNTEKYYLSFMQGKNISIYKDFIYFTAINESNKLYKVNKDGGIEKEVLPYKIKKYLILYDKIFYIDFNDNFYYKNLSDDNIMKISDKKVKGFDIYKGTIYYNVDGVIYTKSLYGKDEINYLNNVVTFKIYKDKIYFISSNKELSLFNLESHEVTILYKNVLEFNIYKNDDKVIYATDTGLYLEKEKLVSKNANKDKNILGYNLSICSDKLYYININKDTEVLDTIKLK